jgi:hypothetical protein
MHGDAVTARGVSAIDDQSQLASIRIVLISQHYPWTFQFLV